MLYIYISHFTFVITLLNMYYYFHFVMEQIIDGHVAKQWRTRD